MEEKPEKSLVRSRLEKGMDKLALKFSSSLQHDANIFYYDILVDLAHVLNLFKCGHISKEEARKILSAILEVRDEGFESLGEYEDVHEAIEAKVIEKAGDAGRKMHTARSRNDEIATCLRLYARDGLIHIMKSLLDLRSILLELAEKHIDAIMPGFTHLQYAQPTRLSHHLIAYHDMLARDFERAMNAFGRVNLCPLGSAAFASTSFRLDRYYTAELLGFDGVVENSVDAVASRDFLIESVFVSTSIMLSLSRIAEELILWSSEFDFVELPDEYASSSSIMPQKKNPDIAELIRAKTGKMIGNLTAASTIYKAMPFTYNRDFQEMNPLLYESLEAASQSVELMLGMVRGLKFRTDVMERKAGKSFTAATELADTLVRKANIPFRSAHKIVGKLALDGKYSPSLEELDEVAMAVVGFKVSEYLSEDDLKKAVDPKLIVESRSNVGGTSREEVERMLEERKKLVLSDAENLSSIICGVTSKLEKLYQEVESILRW